MVIKEVLASMVYKFFDKKSTAGPSSLERMGSGIASSSILADERHKPVTKKFNKKKYIHNLKIIYGN